MTDKPKGTTPENASTNATGARRYRLAPDAAHAAQTNHPSSPKVDAAERPVREADGASAVPQSGTPGKPVATNRINNPRAKKFRP